ncbi:MAG TPA: hypothetical protein PKM57_04570 [Kiritimatiellia bacterium]|nr:hypothetical protein [Kiritimatiellia bacterium]HPS08096.1 hypothetical protein [Kiritimatiellia bacterium]
MIRRDFLKKASAFVGAGALPPWAPTCQAADAQYPEYENNLRDRLWMWGHDSGVYDGPNGVYNIPLSAPISMAEGIQSMGIPNVCVIRGGTPDESYRRQFKDVKRIAWNLSGGSNESYHSLKNYVFGLRDTMPNLTGYYLDDFFRFGDKPGFNRDSEAEPAPAALSLEEMSRLHEETLAYKRRLDLAIVLYTHQLCPAIKPVIRYADVVSLWIWSGTDIQKIEENFKKYRSLVPDKPTLLGIYMWDFGGKKALDQAFMVKQLDYAYKLYKEGQIEGLIFHCTPLCNKGLAAVDYAREWIARHGYERR